MPGACAPAAAPITTVPLPGTAPSVTVPSAPRHRQPSSGTIRKLAAASRGGVLRRSARTCPRGRAAPGRRPLPGANGNGNVAAAVGRQNAGGW